MLRIPLTVAALLLMAPYAGSGTAFPPYTPREPSTLTLVLLGLYLCYMVISFRNNSTQP